MASTSERIACLLRCVIRIRLLSNTDWRLLQEMIEDLKADSSRWDEEVRRWDEEVRRSRVRGVRPGRYGDHGQA